MHTLPRIPYVYHCQVIGNRGAWGMWLAQFFFHFIIDNIYLKPSIHVYGGIHHNACYSRRDLLCINVLHVTRKYCSIILTGILPLLQLVFRQFLKEVMVSF